MARGRRNRKTTRISHPIPMKEFMALLIPLVSVVMGIGIGMLAIYFEYRKRKEMFELYHKERMAALDKGMELPPLPEEFFRHGKPPSPHGKLLGGLVLVFLAVGMFLAFTLTDR